MRSKLIQRGMGMLWIVVSLTWVTAAILCLIFGQRWLAGLQTSFNTGADLADANLSAIQAVIDETQDVLDTTGQSLTSLEVALEQLVVFLADLRPVVWDASDTLTVQIPDALDEIQTAMPTVIETAGAVDQTLIWLSAFRFAIPNPFGDDWEINLGVNYYPEVPLDVALEGVSSSLDGMPDTLRLMEPDLTAVDLGLLRLGLDLQPMIIDLAQVNIQLAEVNPQLDGMQTEIAALQAALVESRAQIASQIRTARSILIGLMALLILSQVPPAYQGWLMLVQASSEEKS